MPPTRSEGMKILIGVAAAAGGILVYDRFVPNAADIRTAEPFDQDIETAERQGLFAATAIVLVAAGLARSLEVFIIGGIAIVGIDFAIKHANAVSPATGKMSGASALSGVSTSYPMPDYATGQDEAA